MTTPEVNQPSHEPNQPPPVLAPPVLNAVAACPPAKAQAWGFWATLGLGFAIGAGMVAGQVVGLVLFVIFAVVRGQKLEPSSLSTNGLGISLAITCSLPLTAGLCWLFAHLKTKQRAQEYLGLTPAGLRSYLWGFGGLAGIQLIWMGMVNVFHIEDVPPFMIETYRTAEFYPLLWFAIVIAAPVMEEMLFRGFFFRGIRQSRAGAAGAVLIPSVLWAAMHVQYGMADISLLFLFGVVLGILRLKSGSILPCMVVHAFSNFMATIQVAFLVGS